MKRFIVILVAAYAAVSLGNEYPSVAGHFAEYYGKIDSDFANSKVLIDLVAKVEQDNNVKCQRSFKKFEFYPRLGRKTYFMAECTGSEVMTLKVKGRYSVTQSGDYTFRIKKVIKK